MSDIHSGLNIDEVTHIDDVPNVEDNLVNIVNNITIDDCTTCSEPINVRPIDPWLYINGVVATGVTEIADTNTIEIKSSLSSTANYGEPLIDVKHSIFASDTLQKLSDFYKGINKSYILHDHLVVLDKINSLKAELLVLESEKAELQGLLDKACVVTQHKDKIAKATEVAIMLENYYKEIWIGRDGYVCALTKPIKTQYAGFSYTFGQFFIRVNWRKEPTAEAADGNHLAANPKYPHPHICKTNECCLGDFSNPIMRALKEFRYLDVLLLMHQYLCTINPESVYVSPLEWLTDKDDAGDICESCLYSCVNCNCDKCEYCRNHVDDCDCVRCPDSGDRIDERPNSEYCEDCSCYEREDPDNADSCYICTF